MAEVAVAASVTSPGAAAVASPRARILIVDDDLAILRTIRRYLSDYEVEVADSVEGALEQLAAHTFDLMLLDHRLPDGLGSAVVAHVRGRRMTLPIILMSGNIEPSEVHAAKSGPDDFIEKPFVREALLSKIERLITAERLRREAAQQRAELDELHERRDREIEVARTIFDRVFARGDFDAAEVRQVVLAADRLAGDAVFGARTPSGTYRWMIGDVTGHTLSSALVTISLAGLFYGLARRPGTLLEVVSAMDRELAETLPASMFCVAAVCELDRRSGELWVWNGGSPDVLIRHAAGGVTELPATNAPLAAERFAPVEHDVVALRVAPGDRILAFSDGLVEQRDEHGTMIGFSRLREIAEGGDAASVFDRMMACVPERSVSGYDDDISLIEVVV